MQKSKNKKEINKKLVLLDAHAILHRGYHALPDFTTSSGQPTGALYGLVAMILKIVTELKPDYLVACYDLPKPTYRHEVYEGYKAHRVKTDEALVSQMEKSKEVCQALNIPIYSKEGFEADDMLGTIVEQVKEEDLDVIIASGDMDTLQLVEDDKVMVYTLKKGINDTILYDEKAVKERYGFEPSLLPDYKGLRGDPSDNIIGIAGIGDKTATELIVQYGTIEEIYQKLKSKNSNLKTKIKPRILKLLEEGEEEAIFSKTLATIRRDAPINFSLPKDGWAHSLDLDRAKNLFRELEFRTLSTRLDSVLKQNGREEEINLNNQKINGEGIDEIKLRETSVALWVVNSNISDPNLEDIYNFAKTDDFEKAREIIFKELEKRESIFVFEEIEKPLLPIVDQMKNYGVKIDIELLKGLEKKYTEELKTIERKIWDQAGLEFNINSPKQLSEILFDKLGLSLKNHKKTGTGVKSTRESELEKMKEMHPIIRLVLEYREIAKLLSTYVTPIPQMVNSDGRLHARFVQAGTTTGRMASEDPNLQNIPVGSERGFAIRKSFVAPEGSVLVAFDYSQIELRIAAILSQDKKLIDIFKENKDVHLSVAARVFGVPEAEVNKEMRRQAKVINFGILYGMGVNALRENLGTDRKTAQEFLVAYFEQFAELADYIDRVKEEANRLGYTKTIFGRRRYFEGIKSKIPYVKAAAERMAVNAPIQGTQADIIKIAMKRIDDYLTREGLKSKVHLILQIHDELVYEMSKDVAERINVEIKKIMENVLTPEQTLGIPIITNSAVGNNWGEMK